MLGPLGAQSFEHEADEISQALCDEVKKYFLWIFYLPNWDVNFKNPA